jgi:hypothetical protein
VSFCGFQGNAAGQHGFAEAVMFSKRGFGGSAPDIMCLFKKNAEAFSFLESEQRVWISTLSVFVSY